jgi:hypothetical protein
MVSWQINAERIPIPNPSSVDRRLGKEIMRIDFYAHGFHPRFLGSELRGEGASEQVALLRSAVQNTKIDTVDFSPEKFFNIA